MPADEELRQLIRAAGAKATRGRLRVLEILRAESHPLSHADLEDHLQDGAEGSIDRVTLYRILDSLVSCGLAFKAVDPRGVFRFSAAGGRRPHDGHVHFRCTGCGGMFCLEAVPPPPPELPRGFRLSATAYDVHGVCAACCEQEVSTVRRNA